MSILGQSRFDIGVDLRPIWGVVQLTDLSVPECSLEKWKIDPSSILARMGRRNPVETVVEEVSLENFRRATPSARGDNKIIPE